MYVEFNVRDLNDMTATVYDKVNGDYYGPHNHLAIGYGCFLFDRESPTVQIIRNMLSNQHIEFREKQVR